MSLDQSARPRIIRGPHAEGDPALLERAMRDVVKRHRPSWLLPLIFLMGFIVGWMAFFVLVMFLP